MLAVIAAVLFALALLVELTHHALGSIGSTVLTTAGLLLFALHFGYTRGSTSRRRR